MLESTCNLAAAFSHKHTLAPRVLALASTRRGASMFTPTCRCLARWLQSGHVAHVLRLKLPLDQSSSQFAKCWRIVLRGLQPRLAGTTTDAYIIAPLAVSRRSVRFGGRLDGNDFSKRGNTPTNSVGFQSKCPKWPIQTNLRCHAKPPTVQSS
jgi:hypothetical protein